MKIKTAAKKWYASLPVGLSKATMKGYFTVMNCIVYFIGEMKVVDIKRTDIKTLVNITMVKESYSKGVGNGYSTKTRRNICSVLNLIFEYLFDEELIFVNPLSKPIKVNVTGRTVNTRSDGSALPDPFSANEIASLIHAETEFPQSVNAFHFDCLTGLRISELLALTWGDITTHMQGGRKVALLHVRQSLVLGQYKCTKTDRSYRTIPLTEHAYNILLTQQKYSLNKEEREYDFFDGINVTKRKDKFIFLDDSSGEAWESVDKYREKFFRQHVNNTCVRYRPPSQARHTYATRMVRNNLPMTWIAQMLGHSKIKMLEERYASWRTQQYSLSTLDLANQASSLAA